jgi:hypothetical protein
VKIDGTNGAAIAALVTLALTVLAAFGFQLNPELLDQETLLQFGQAVATIATIVGLFFARNNKTSDQEAGARPEVPAPLPITTTPVIIADRRAPVAVLPVAPVQPVAPVPATITEQVSPVPVAEVAPVTDKDR